MSSLWESDDEEVGHTPKPGSGYQPPKESVGMNPIFKQSKPIMEDMNPLQKEIAHLHFCVGVFACATVVLCGVIIIMNVSDRYHYHGPDVSPLAPSSSVNSVPLAVITSSDKLTIAVCRLKPVTSPSGLEPRGVIKFYEEDGDSDNSSPSETAETNSGQVRVVSDIDNLASGGTYSLQMIEFAPSRDISSGSDLKSFPSYNPNNDRRPCQQVGVLGDIQSDNAGLATSDSVRPGLSISDIGGRALILKDGASGCQRENNPREKTNLDAIAYCDIVLVDPAKHTYSAVADGDSASNEKLEDDIEQFGPPDPFAQLFSMAQANPIPSSDKSFSVDDVDNDEANRKKIHRERRRRRRNRARLRWVDGPFDQEETSNDGSGSGSDSHEGSSSAGRDPFNAFFRSGAGAAGLSDMGEKNQNKASKRRRASASASAPAAQDPFSKFFGNMNNDNDSEIDLDDDGPSMYGQEEEGEENSQSGGLDPENFSIDQAETEAMNILKSDPQLNSAQNLADQIRSIDQAQSLNGMGADNPGNMENMDEMMMMNDNTQDNMAESEYDDSSNSNDGSESFEDMASEATTLLKQLDEQENAEKAEEAAKAAKAAAVAAQTEAAASPPPSSPSPSPSPLPSNNPFAPHPSSTTSTPTPSFGGNKIDCIGQWKPWESCTQTCGGGTQIRFYQILSPSQNGGKDCEAATGNSETQVCNTDACPSPPVDCVGDFTPWDDCSATCGGGSQSRTYKITIPSSNGGMPCPTPDGEPSTRPCNIDACPACDRVTEDGVKCVFPFKFKGISFSDCTLFEATNGKEWCATEVTPSPENTDTGGSEVRGQWGACKPCGADPDAGDMMGTDPFSMGAGADAGAAGTGIGPEPAESASQMLERMFDPFGGEVDPSTPPSEIPSGVPTPAPDTPPREPSTPASPIKVEGEGDGNLVKPAGEFIKDALKAQATQEAEKQEEEAEEEAAAESMAIFDPFSLPPDDAADEGGDGGQMTSFDPFAALFGPASQSGQGI